MPPTESVELPKGFAGVVRLFPLPNLVVFPHVVQALHVFEPRYLEMLEDALAGDQLIAMALLQPGWEAEYEGRPAIFPVTCLGRVMAHARLENGRYNILLHGLRRAAIVREFPPERAFRLAEVAILEDLYPAGNADGRTRMQAEILSAFRQLGSQSEEAKEQVDELLGKQVPLGELVDIVAYTLPLKSVFKQQLLAEWNVDIRSDMLLRQIQSAGQAASAAGDSPFPPSFSQN
jgi:ATP-dependent Lon protease